MLFFNIFNSERSVEELIEESFFDINLYRETNWIPSIEGSD